jgi:hypothetical protein
MTPTASLQVKIANATGACVVATGVLGWLAFDAGVLGFWVGIVVFAPLSVFAEIRLRQRRGLPPLGKEYRDVPPSALEQRREDDLGDGPGDSVGRADPL